MSRIAADLEQLPEHVLFELARNESAPRLYRKEAVEILLRKGSAKANHPDIADLKAEITEEIGSLEEVVLVPVPDSKLETGPLKASVTTATMFGVQKMDKEIQPANEAKSSSTTN